MTPAGIELERRRARKKIEYVVKEYSGDIHIYSVVRVSRCVLHRDHPPRSGESQLRWTFR